MLSFLEGLFCVQPLVPFLLLVFPSLSWLCPFLQISNRLFWVCSSTFLCFVFFLCSDLKVVFKRIVYPVLSWC